MVSLIARDLVCSNMNLDIERYGEITAKNERFGDARTYQRSRDRTIMLFVRTQFSASKYFCKSFISVL